MNNPAIELAPDHRAQDFQRGQETVWPMMQVKSEWRVTADASPRVRKEFSGEDGRIRRLGKEPAFEDSGKD